MTMDSPLESHSALGREIGVELFVKRDDLLPFPLAGNKVRKLSAELLQSDQALDVVISNGAIESNHCRTLAFLAARWGFRAHVVLHGDMTRAKRSADMLSALGATYDLVPSEEIAKTIHARSRAFSNEGRQVRVVPGGCHTPNGARVYKEAAAGVLHDVSVDVVVMASGTGATQGGILAAAAGLQQPPRVIGISIAREHQRGEAAVREAAYWAGAPQGVPIEFVDRYRDGGYGRSSESTRNAVQLGWRFGLPLDSTYTGKAFAGLQDLIRSGSIERGARVLFWHTGGLWNQLSSQNNIGDASPDTED